MRHVFRLSLRRALLAVAVLSLAGEARAVIPTSERDALIAIFNATGGISWSSKRGWLGGPGSECSWEGIQCDQGNTTVVSFYLNGNNIRGPLPPQLANLPNLKVLNLSYNPLGAFPSALGSLTKLEELNLQSCEITGAVPDVFGSVRELRILYVDGNRLTGSIPSSLGNLTKLEELSFADDDLTGTLPPAVFRLPALRYLRFSYNDLTGSIPADVGSLANLVTLDLSVNQLTGSIPTQLSNLAKLENLNLSSNQLTGTIPSDLGRLSNLQFLDLGTNRLTGSLPSGITGLANLEVLSVYSNLLSGPLPSDLGRLVKLVRLYIGGNTFSGALPTSMSGLVLLEDFFAGDNDLTDLSAASLATLPKLRNLSAYNNELTGPFPAALASSPSLIVIDLSGNHLTGPLPPLAGLRTLEELHVEYNQLTGGVPSLPDGFHTLHLDQNKFDGVLDFATLPRGLRDLRAPENSFTGEIGPSLGLLTELRYVSLQRNKLTGSLPSEIGNLTRLEDLALGENQISGGIPGEIGNLVNLRSLAIWQTRLSGPIPSSIGNLTRLWYLDLDGNALTGTIPTSIGNLTELEQIYLRDNALVGPIPEEIGNLVKLTNLFLTGNGLSGSLPSGFTNLVLLERAYLDGNQISGSLPSGLGRLTKLGNFNMQANQLSGPIPSDLAGMASLTELNLSFNDLSGPIPGELGLLPELRDLNLSENDLTGPLPAGLSRASNLRYLDLSFCAIDGNVPASWGDLSNLGFFYADGNKLSGELPTELTKLTNLQDGYGLYLRWNALRIESGALREFMLQKSSYFDETQTVAPPGLTTIPTSTSVTVRWVPIRYTDDGGGYEILVAPSAQGPFQVAGATASKEDSSYTVRNLRPSTNYAFKVRTFTNPHPINPNKVVSEDSAAVTAQTSPQGNVTITLDPGSLRVLNGGSGVMTVRLSPAQSTSTAIAIATTDPNTAGVPASVTVNANATSASFNVGGFRGGSAVITATLPAALGGGVAAADIVVAQSSCDRPDTPLFTSVPAANVRAGNSFTLSWTPTLAQDPEGIYQIDVAPNEDCSTGRVRYTSSRPSIAVPTENGRVATYCAVVRAVSSLGCPSGDSNAVTVRTELGPASFVVTQAQAPAGVVVAGGAPPSGSTVVFKNIGSQAATLNLAATIGFVRPNPTSAPNVAPGASVTVTLEFDPASALAQATLFGGICGTWDALGPKTVCTSVTLTVLGSAPASPARPSRLGIAGSNEVHFITPRGVAPPTSTVYLVNSGSQPARIAPRVGPGGAWLRVDGGSGTIPPGQTVALTLSVDRTKRATADGNGPYATYVTFENVDGLSTDRAVLQVFDEEPVSIQTGIRRTRLDANTYSLILPTGVSAQGSGALFLSDGWIRNKSGSVLGADLYYTPAGADGIGHPLVKRAQVQLQPYSTYRLADFVRGLFDVTGSGLVEIRSTDISSLSVRTTVDSLTQKESGAVRYGAEIPTVQSREGASLSRYGGAPLVITGLKGGAGSGFRTNVILAETSGAELTARLSLRLADGTQARTRNITVKAYSKEQINFNDDSLFPQGESYDGASLEVTPVEGIGSIAGFATVIDNASQGYTTRAGRFVQETVETNLRALRAEGKGRNALAPRALSRFVIAAAARASGANNSLFTTTVSITNGVGSTANLTLRYLPDDGSTVEPKTLSIPGRRTVTLTDVVGTFFGVTNNTAGMVFVEGADIRKVVVTSDTGTPLSLTDASRGASPSTLAAYAPEAVEALGNPAGGPPSAVVSHPGLEESDRYRTNLILAETTGQPVRVRVKVVPAGSLGQPLAQKEYDLRAFQRLQINRFLSDVAATESGAVQYVDVETVVEWVSGAGRVLAVATKIDNDPNSKRSDIYVLGPTGSNQGTIGF